MDLAKFFLLATPLLTGCASASAPATQQQKDEADVTYLVCMHKAARQLDDGKSDAASVALAIMPSCTSEFRNSLRVSNREMNPQARKMFESDIERRQIEIATKMVLEERQKPMTTF
jgi:hypothetical protein